MIVRPRWGLLLFALSFATCASPTMRPDPVAAPHLYSFHPAIVQQQLRQQGIELRDGYLSRDADHIALRYIENNYADPAPRSYRCESGVFTVDHRPESDQPSNTLLDDLPNRGAGEMPIALDATRQIVVTWSSLSHQVRLRNADSPASMLITISANDPPESLFNLPDRFFLVTGPSTAGAMKLSDPPGLRPNGPRHVFILKKTAASISCESEMDVPASRILDVDPWSNQVLATEFVWIGWSPLFYGTPHWQSNRFLYDLKTGRRTDLPLISGAVNLPDAFFLQSDPFVKP